MEKDENFTEAHNFPASFGSTNYNSISPFHHHHQQQQQQQQEMIKFRINEEGEACEENKYNTDGGGTMEYMLSYPEQQQQQITTTPGPGLISYGSSSNFEKLNFADVMQFADFGPKLALNQTKSNSEESGIDPVYFLKFPVLNDRILMGDEHQNSIMVENEDRERLKELQEGASVREENELARVSDIDNAVQIQFLGGSDDQDLEKNNNTIQESLSKNKRKRPRTIKTSEEVESQRMTHIAVERNRRKQMNEHLRVLRSLMPGSYVQRGDQASIIGGAIEFVRELEQLLQCLESQKRRRLFGEGQKHVGDSGTIAIAQQLQAQPQPQTPPFFPPLPLPNDQMKLIVDLEATGLREETAENKSCLADVEVKLLGFDAMIKILSRRRPGQLIQTIAALEDLQFNILHTNITTIEHTVLYSFNVKVGSDSRFSTAEDIARSVQQIFSFIHANSGI